MRALAIEREKLFVRGGVSAGNLSQIDGGLDYTQATPVAAAAQSNPINSTLSSLSALGSAQERMVGPQVSHLSQVARYYTRMFSPGLGSGSPGNAPGWDIYVHLQANRVSVVGLAYAHPLLLHAKGSPLVSVAFLPTFANISEHLSGKRKKGSLWVEATTVIANATTADGRVWPLRAGMRGNLVEVNQRLVTHPTLLIKKPATQGHLALIITHLKRVLEVTRELLSETDYTALCTARGLPGPTGH